MDGTGAEFNFGQFLLLGSNIAKTVWGKVARTRMAPPKSIFNVRLWTKGRCLIRNEEQ